MNDDIKENNIPALYKPLLMYFLVNDNRNNPSSSMGKVIKSLVSNLKKWEAIFRRNDISGLNSAYNELKVI